MGIRAHTFKNKPLVLFFLCTKWKEGEMRRGEGREKVPFFKSYFLLFVKFFDGREERERRERGNEQKTKLRTTLSNGYLGSRNDEERSVMR